MHFLSIILTNLSFSCLVFTLVCHFENNQVYVDTRKCCSFILRWSLQRQASLTWGCLYTFFTLVVFAFATCKCPVDFRWRDMWVACDLPSGFWSTSHLCTSLLHYEKDLVNVYGSLIHYLNCYPLFSGWLYYLKQQKGCFKRCKP